MEVDPGNQTQRVLISSNTARYRGIEAFSGTNKVVTSATALNKLVILDSLSGQIERELTTSGFIRSFSTFGHCVIAGIDGTDSIEVFDLNSSQTKPVLTEGVNLTENDFSGIKNIAVDDKTGTVFARSNIPCNPSITTCDKDFNRVVSFGDSLAESLRNRCR